eukprot:PhF_6_TR15502/c0_g1_i2/m.24127
MSDSILNTGSSPMKFPTTSTFNSQLDRARTFVRSLSDADTKMEVLDTYLSTVGNPDEATAIIQCVTDKTFWKETKSLALEQLSGKALDGCPIPEDVPTDFQALFYEVSGGDDTMSYTDFEHVARDFGEADRLHTVPQKIIDSGVVTPRFFEKWMTDSLVLPSTLQAPTPTKFDVPTPSKNQLPPRTTPKKTVSSSTTTPSTTPLTALDGAIVGGPPISPSLAPAVGLAIPQGGLITPSSQRSPCTSTQASPRTPSVDMGMAGGGAALKPYVKYQPGTPSGSGTAVPSFMRGTQASKTKVETKPAN